MKNVLIAFLVTIIVASGCQKKDAVPSEKAEPTTIKKKKSIRFSSPESRVNNEIDIDTDGYLLLSKSTIDSYLRYLTSRTHSQVQTHLSSEGFHSYGADIYGQDYASDTVTVSQATDYLINQNLVVRIDDILFRPTTPDNNCTDTRWDFALAMHISNKNSTSFSDLEGGTYNSTYMNKFATDAERAETIYEFMSTTPIGYSESASSCLQASGRPWFGYGSWGATGSCWTDHPNNWRDENGDGIADPTYCRGYARSYYFLKIKIFESDEECHPSFVAC